MIVPIVDASLSYEDMHLFEDAEDIAIKVLPVAFCPAVSLMLAEVDVDGFRLMKFVERNLNSVLKGVVVSDNENESVISLCDGLFGRLKKTVYDHIYVGAEVEVVIQDVDPNNNILYLRLNKPEIERALLMEI